MSVFTSPQILPVSAAAKFPHLPEIAHRIKVGGLVTHEIVNAMGLTVTLGGKPLPVHSIRYYSGTDKLAFVSFRGPRGGFYTGYVYRDKPSEVVYNKHGVDTNNMVAPISNVVTA